MLSNAYFLANIGFDTAENEPAENLQNLNLLIFPISGDAGTLPRAARVRGGLARGRGLGQAVPAGAGAGIAVALEVCARGRVLVRERRLAKFRQNVARFRLYRLRFLQENMRFAAFFKIYQIL